MKKGHKRKFGLVIEKARLVIEKARKEMKEQERDRKRDRTLAEKIANVESERKLAAVRRVKDAEDQEHAHSKKFMQPDSVDKTSTKDNLQHDTTATSKSEGTALPKWLNYAAFISHKKVSDVYMGAWTLTFILLDAF
jgi:hypothetical protein